MYFGNRRPRGFHYTYRFNTQRGDVLRRLKEGEPPEQIAADSEREWRAVSGRLPQGVDRQRGCCPAVLAFMFLLVASLVAAIFILC